MLKILRKYTYIYFDLQNCKNIFSLKLIINLLNHAFFNLIAIL